MPFTGLKGDYQSIPVLTTPPLLGRFDGSDCITTRGEPVYTMAPNDRPCIRRISTIRRAAPCCT